MKISTHLGATLVTAVAMLAGCASTNGAQSTTTTAAQVTPPVTGYPCPMDVGDVQVAAVDAKGYAAIDFTTTAGNVTELRDRVHAMADAHDRAPNGLMMRGQGVPGEAWVFGNITLPLSTASVEEIPGGARMVLSPTRSSDLSRLQQDTSAWAMRLSYGQCPVAPPAQ